MPVAAGGDCRSRSGAMESARRRVGNPRRKGPGLLRLEDNAEAMMVLRAAVLTERWEETLAHVRATLASDRRLDGHWQSPDMRAELKAGVPSAPPAPQGGGEQRRSE